MTRTQDDPCDYVVHGDGGEEIAILTFPAVEPPFLAALDAPDRLLAMTLLNDYSLGDAAAELGVALHEVEARVAALLRTLNMESVRQLIVTALWHSLTTGRAPEPFEPPVK